MHPPVFDYAAPDSLAAIAHLGVRNIDLPLLPHRVWSAIKEARG